MVDDFCRQGSAQGCVLDSRDKSEHTAKTDQASQVANPLNPKLNAKILHPSSPSGNLGQLHGNKALKKQLNPNRGPNPQNVRFIRSCFVRSCQDENRGEDGEEAVRK